MSAILNFGHPLSPEAQALLKKVIRDSGDSNELVLVQYPTHVDFSHPVAPQVSEMVTQAGKQLEKISGGSSLEETSRIYFITPGLSDVAVMQVVELFGRTGGLPSLILARRDRLKGGFIPYAVIHLEDVRAKSRGYRSAIPIVTRL